MQKLASPLNRLVKLELLLAWKISVQKRIYLDKSLLHAVLNS